MGGLESRFNTLLVEGRAEEAMTMWEENFELQTRHQPNSQIKASQYRDTPLHCAVRFEMKDMLQEFLTRGGNPFVMNGNEETPLHIVCRAAKISSRKSKKRAEFLRMMLDRIPTEESFEVMYSTSQEMGNSIGRGLSFGSSEKGLSEKGLDESLSRYEKGLSMDSSFQSSVSGLSNGDLSLKSIADVDAHYLGVQDKSRNTPLHLAAASGLLECVELLVAHNAPLFVRNVADQTPCDVAKESKEIIIAKQLESKMVFDYHGGLSDESSPNKRAPNKALRSVQAIKELREGIVKQVADRLKRSTTDSQALLMAYGWSEELLMEAWNSDKAATCERAGISVDSVVVEEITPYVSFSTQNCGICDEEIPADQKTVTPCEHNFCRDCWKMYIEGQISDGGGKEIRCPAFQCYKIVVPS